MNDGAMLMYVKDGIAYPVALTESEYTLLQLFVKTFEPLKIVKGMPQGQVTNFTGSQVKE